MKLSEALQDERIDDNTLVIIKDMYGGVIVCGRWYQDKNLAWGNLDVSVEFMAERNIAIVQLQVI